MSNLRDAQQQTWATGDFSMVGTGQVLVGELLCDSIPLFADQLVLDVATGAGNTALAAARRVCKVTGIDFVPALLERARERAQAERLKIRFEPGDADAIPFPAESFDVVLSTFGAIFVPDPERAAWEMLRVCRHGGKIGMANWVAKGMIGEMFKINAAFAPPPPGIPPPALWGDEEVVRQRFGNRVSSLRFVEREALFRHHSPETWVEFMKTYFGPTMRAHAALGERAGELTAALVDLAHRHNESPKDAPDGTWFARARYVEVVAVKA